MRYRDLTGQRFGNLYVNFRAEDKIEPSGYHCVMWNCTCDCGKVVNVRAKSLTGGVTKSCGCLAKKQLSERAGKHHGYGTRLYHVWNSLRQRCNNPNNRAYANYGGRGIHICEEWDDFATFREWAYSSGYDETAEKGKCTLDRIDVNVGYNPNNCRWVSLSEQNKNKTTTPYYTLNGVTHNLKEWSVITGIKYETLWRRYKAGWSAERSLS